MCCRVSFIEFPRTFKENAMLTVQSFSKFLVALVGLLLTLAPIQPARADPVVTTNYSAPHYPDGELRATFRATPIGDGTWQIEATIRPHSIWLPDSVWGNFYGYSKLRGTATAAVTVAPGVTTSMGAGGMY